jgi:methionyl aminopeptidase
VFLASDILTFSMATPEISIGVFQMIRQSFLRSGVCYTSINPARIYNRRLHALSDLELGSFGNYTLILPSEPFVDGVAHIPMKSVPERIKRPPYMTGTLQEISLKASDPFAGDPYSGDGRIDLGSDDEAKLRRAAKLAKTVLDRTKDWVKVN